MKILKIIFYAIKETIKAENLRKKIYRCHICGSRKKLHVVPTVGIYYECEKCWINNWKELVK